MFLRLCLYPGGGRRKKGLGWGPGASHTLNHSAPAASGPLHTLFFPPGTFPSISGPSCPWSTIGPPLAVTPSHSGVQGLLYARSGSRAFCTTAQSLVLLVARLHVFLSDQPLGSVHCGQAPGTPCAQHTAAERMSAVETARAGPSSQNCSTRGPGAEVATRGLGIRGTVWWGTRERSGCRVPARGVSPQAGLGRCP